MSLCQTCGSRGYSQALVLCGKCQTIAEHSYCLDNLVETDDGIHWTCEFCEPRVIELSDSTNSDPDTETIEPFKSIMGLQDHSENSLHPLISEEAQRVIKQEQNIVGDQHLLHQESDATAAVSKTGSPEKSSYSSILDDDFWSTIELLPDPIWMGSFQIYGRYSHTIHGMLAHISNETCKEAEEETRSLPLPLCLEMVPKVDIWPLKFNKLIPTVNNIAVYFFPEDYRAEREYDYLVDDIIDHDFSMIARVNDVELLIFTSRELPQDNWRYKRKYYLWGMFRRKKKTLPQNQRDESSSSIQESIT